MTTLRPVKEQAGTELCLKLNTHAVNLEHQLQHQRYLLGYLTTQSAYKNQQVGIKYNMPKIWIMENIFISMTCKLTGVLVWYHHNSTPDLEIINNYIP